MQMPGVSPPSTSTSILPLPAPTVPPRRCGSSSTVMARTGRPSKTLSALTLRYSSPGISRRFPAASLAAYNAGCSDPGIAPRGNAPSPCFAHHPVEIGRLYTGPRSGLDHLRAAAIFDRSPSVRAAIRSVSSSVGFAHGLSAVGRHLTGGAARGAGTEGSSRLTVGTEQ